MDTDDFRRFQREIKGMDRGMAKALNKEFREVISRRIVPTAQRNAGWSSRIPGAIKPTVGVTRVGVMVAGGRAPHGRPLEGIGGNKSFRHPVFGNRNVWVNQGTRPYLAPAVEKHGDDAVRAASEVVEDAARRIGFR